MPPTRSRTDPAVRLLELGIVCGALTGLAGLDETVLTEVAERLDDPHEPRCRTGQRIATVAAVTGATRGAVAVLAATVPGPTAADTAPVARLLLGAPSTALAQAWVAIGAPPVEDQHAAARACGWPREALDLLAGP